MTAGDKVFAGSVPEIYDRFLVPLIFEPYARDLAARAGKTAPRDVLEVAAGTGVLTRALASLLPATARILATDLNQPMLDQAAARQQGDARITWRQADALALPLGERSVDVVVCQFGAMFFPDKTEGYREARRVLKEGGRYLFNVWDRISENEFADVVTDALAALYPEAPPRFLARTPHGYCDPGRIRAELMAAGFRAIAIENVEHKSEARDARDAAIAFCQGTPLRNEIETRDPGGLDRATKTATEALRRRFGGGPIVSRIKAYVIAATREP